ncbi:glycoside hydrolase family 20 zincin-like fold domain-containing protein [Arenibacter latericius]|uniref:glycoside hydrolase family 20 zincin-like fold domain-containing protein n=1 Tax=Arenibacter latericius TaxID=86104 RepID=UPI0004054DA4|nr:glycoside hydrolase family 20 zincin-like fold domain-containing protein [Arenibacter latericius]
MKNTSFLFLLSFTILLFACSSQEQKMGEFKLLPQPQEFNITGVSTFSPSMEIAHAGLNQETLPILTRGILPLKEDDNKGKSHLNYQIDAAMDIPSEGYTLSIAKESIDIKAKDEAGLFYAFATLEQLYEDAKDQKVNLPLCEITDYPKLSYRAVHIDVKHHLEKTDYYYGLMNKLASYKVNGIILEIEDKLKFKRQPTIASEDALSIEEWRKISDYAKERNIEISPLVQGLGHASFILKHPEYHDLRDNPNSDWAFNPLDPKTYEVQFDLYLDAMEAFPHGKYLHVGGDEVHTTGRDSKEPALKLQLIWLDKVSKFAEEHNRTPIFWDDMPLLQADVYAPMFKPEMTEEEVEKVWEENEHKLLAFLDDFPKNCIYMRWNYETPQAPGNIKAMQWFTDHGMEVMGATAGQTRWVLMPQNDSNMDNIRSFAVSSIESGSKGLLLTLWDDDSPHFELYMRGILAFAEYSWTGDKRSNEEIKSAFRQREYGYPLAATENAFISDLEEPVAFWKNALLKGNKRNYLKTMQNPMEDGLMDFPNINDKGAWSIANEDRLEKAAQYIELTDSIAKKITAARSKALRNDYNLQVYEQVNKLAQYSPKILLTLAEYDSAKNQDEIIASSEKLKELKSGFNSLRKELENVYRKTRILNKPENYILDQDHHVHLANQSLNFDWQFYAEMLFFEKLDEELEKEMYMEISDPLKK